MKWSLPDWNFRNPATDRHLFYINFYYLWSFKINALVIIEFAPDQGTVWKSRILPLDTFIGNCY